MVAKSVVIHSSVNTSVSGRFSLCATSMLGVAETSAARLELKKKSLDTRFSISGRQASRHKTDVFADGMLSVDAPINGKPDGSSEQLLGAGTPATIRWSPATIRW